MSDPTYRILLVDDHPLVREGLAQLINRAPDLEVCGEAGDASEALTLLDELEPDLVTIDISLPGHDGLVLLRDIRARYPKLPALVISMHEESLYAERVLRAGAQGYLSKGEARGQVTTAIRQILGGELYVSTHIASRLITRVVGGETPAVGIANSEEPLTSRLEPLSNRELEVFRLVGEGLGPTDIAERLHLSVKTVQTHKANIRRKLKLDNARELTREAMRWVETSAG